MVVVFLLKFRIYLQFSQIILSKFYINLHKREEKLVCGIVVKEKFVKLSFIFYFPIEFKFYSKVVVKMEGKGRSRGRGRPTDPAPDNGRRPGNGANSRRDNGGGNGGGGGGGGGRSVKHSINLFYIV